MIQKNALRLAGILGALAVGLGAFGAHGLKDILSNLETTETWKTAVFYHFVHTVMMAFLAIFPGKFPRFAFLGFLVGIVLFSGSLYFLALGGPRWLGPITPLGGLAFIIGWLSLLNSRGNDLADEEK